MGITFTQSGAAKIKKVVHQVLNQPRSRDGDRQPTHAVDTVIWGLIFGRPDGELAISNRYAFVRVYPDLSGTTGDFRMPNNNIAFIIGDTQADIGTAQEVNGNISVPGDSVVMMKFAGYDGQNQPVFLFQFESTDPNFLPVTPHDHRDNYNGGFSFSVFHPGTGLPQQPWSM